MNRLKNKNIIITGGNSGIGYATAEKIIVEGGNPLIVGKDKEKIDAAVKKLGKMARGYVADVSKLADLDNLYTQIKGDFRVIHGVVANAGVAILELCEMISEKSMHDSFTVNFQGSFFTAQKAIKLMQDGGTIIFISSLAAQKVFPGSLMYSATKAALRSITSSMALELASRNIRVNSVSPGTIFTPLFEKLGLTPEQFDTVIKNHKAKIPIQRIGTPHEIANIIVFLLSEESSYITGADILADGGLAHIA